MPEFRDRLRSAVLAPDEHNLDVMLDQIEALHEEIRRHSRIDSHRVDFDASFRYADEVAALRDRLVEEYRLDYRPHIHLDTVNGWIWLLFVGHDFDAELLPLDPAGVAVCRRARDQIAQLRHADSFSADFHKTGLCPYATSFYVCRDDTELRSLHSVDLEPRGDESFGEVHAHHVTLENSRPANGVVSAWATLAKLGTDGLKRYVAMLMAQGLYLRRRAARRFSAQFEILNEYANFCATVMLVRFVSPDLDFDDLLDDDAARVAHNRLAHAFFRWLDVEQPAVAPLIGIVPRYRIERIGVPITAFLLYPMSPELDRERCDDLLARLVAAKRMFLGTVATSPAPRVETRASRASRAAPGAPPSRARPSARSRAGRSGPSRCVCPCSPRW